MRNPESKANIKTEASAAKPVLWDRVYGRLVYSEQ